MSLRTDLGRVRGLGSAKEGVAHWWAQRVTAVALVPLLRLSGVEADDAGLRERIAAEAPDDTPAALDAVWMESPVTFGAQGAAGCGGDRPSAGILAAGLAAQGRPAELIAARCYCPSDAAETLQLRAVETVAGRRLHPHWQAGTRPVRV